MHSHVRQIRPRLDSFESAVSAFRAAEYDRCLVALHGHGTLAGTLLRTRCFLRLGRVSEAAEAIDSLDLEGLPSGDAAEVRTLAAVVQMSLGDAEGAEETLLDARVKAYGSGCAALEADVDYTTAVFYGSQGRFSEARSAAQRVLDIEVSTASARWLREPSITRLFSVEELRARALDVFGQLAAKENRFDDQVTFIRQAFTELEHSETRDHYIESHLLSNLSVLIRDRYLPDVFEFVRERAARMHFSSFTKKFEFEIHRSLGWCSALRGDHVGALREFRKSSETAPSVALRLQAILDRAALAQELSENTSADEEFDYASQLYEQVDWKSAAGDDVFSLLSMAQNFAGRDCLEARRAFDRYVQYKRNQPFTSGARGDARASAWEHHVNALVLRAEGHAERAVIASLTAFETYERVGHAWSAASVAADLYELTGEPRYFHYASCQATKMPQSQLARRVAKFEVEAAPSAR